MTEFPNKNLRKCNQSECIRGKVQLNSCNRIETETSGPLTTKVDCDKLLLGILQWKSELFFPDLSPIIEGGISK